VEAPLTRTNPAKCNGCNACVKACPMMVLELVDGLARPVPGREDKCFRCGHCVMVCARDAMRVDGLDPADFVEALPWGFDADALDRFLQSRRSVRRFRDEPVDRAVLDRLLEMAATAPMGWPPHTTAALVLTDKAEIRRLLTVMRTGYGQMDRMTRNVFGRAMMRLVAGRDAWAMLRDYILDLTREANVLFRDKGQDKYLYDAPVVILFLGDRNGLSWDQNAVLATQNAMLAAHALGLGATMIGLVPPIVERSRALRQRWGIGDHQAVVSALVVGHPALKFVRVQRRRLASVRYA
jgi:nitroreductase/NAD-dependent dihydropyrimidine dehydrogenase PreA subunit